ncbi:MAG: ParB/RepB/Spo0J family partition protein [Thermomicrobiales bacterium]
MTEFVERTSIDLRFSKYRIQNQAREARLLASIAQRGLEQPLVGVDTPEGRQLLDGFKRYRCAEKLHMECVPYVSWGEDATQGISRLLGATTQQSLSILEQARFIEELISVQGLSHADVASLLSRSKAWVHTRYHLLRHMRSTVRDILFRGAFPVYSYMVTLRPFMRMNGSNGPEIERFVELLTNQRLSIRQIELLAHGYFRGTPALRTAIEEGKWKWTLDQMQAVPPNPEGCNAVERAFLQELERLLQAMQHVMTGGRHPQLQTNNFHAQVNLLLASLLGRRDAFFQEMEELYDRSGQASRHFSTASGGDAPARDQSPPACQS